MTSIDFDIYMAKIREARECNPKKRTKEQERMLKLYFFGKSYNELMDYTQDCPKKLHI